MSGCPSGVRGGFHVRAAAVGVWPATETGASETTAATLAIAAIEAKNPVFMETPLAIDAVYDALSSAKGQYLGPRKLSAARAFTLHTVALLEPEGQTSGRRSAELSEHHALRMTEAFDR